MSEQETRPEAADAAAEEPTVVETAAPTTELERPERLEPTLERPAVDAGDGASEQDGAATADGDAPAAGKPSPIAGARDFIRTHKPLVIGSTGLLAVVVALLVVAGVHAASVPANDVIIANARTRVTAPDYDGGTWGDITPLHVVDVKVKGVARSKTAIDSASAQFGASGYANADVVVTFENGSVRSTKEATLGFAKVSGNWTAIGSETDTSVSFEPTAGVSEDRVVENATELLDRAEQQLGAKTGEVSLAGIYTNGQVKVSASDYDADAKTDVVTLSCAKTGTFDAYATQIRATFSFRSVSGLWEITDVSVPADAKARKFTPLLGTWEGTFQTQETGGGKCLAASESPLSITFSEQEASGALDGKDSQLTGKISCVAHLHAQPSRDSRSQEGDEALVDVPLTATCESESDGATVFTGTLPDQAGGTMTVELDFGGSEDATAATAKVTTSYESTTSFLFIPRTETLTYTDTYLLRKQG